MAVIKNEDYGKSTTLAPEASVVWTAEELKKMCRFHGIAPAEDSLWMFEYDLGSGRRLDVLTIDLKSLWVRGWEVKTSRRDFVADKKWRDYLPFVNEFSFCAPPGVIDPKEIQKGIGLYEPEKIEGWHDVRWKLACRKKPDRLQPEFASPTYTELWMTKLLVEFVRNLKWRDGRLTGWCECGKKLELDHDGRQGGTR